MAKYRKMAHNLEVLLTGKYEAGRIDLNDLGNPALLRFSHEMALRNQKLPPLTREQKEQLREVWSPYFVCMDDRFHRLYTKYSGNFDPAYIPEDIMFLHIDRKLSDRVESKYLDNKCYYYRLFDGIPMPRALACRVGGIWLNDRMEPLSEKKVIDRIHETEECVIKEATGSECGLGVHFRQSKDVGEQTLRELDEMSCDLVIQESIRQHSVLTGLHKDSVNTLRLVSLLREGQVKVYVALLRIGRGISRVDNIHSGGTLVGIQEDGSLMERGYCSNLTSTDRLPDSGISFGGLMIPGFEKAVELVKRAHPMIAHFKMVSWDIAIGEAEEPILVEANYSLGMVREPQICCGPLFGEDTKDILKETLTRKRFWTLW